MVKHVNPGQSPTGPWSGVTPSVTPRHLHVSVIVVSIGIVIVVIIGIVIFVIITTKIIITTMVIILNITPISNVNILTIILMSSLSIL